MSQERERVEGHDSYSRRLKRPVEPERSRKSMSGTQTGSGNISTPCAACKLLRRRCAQECPFSPYFSPQEPHKFACVHKIFGASNVSKMLMEVPESQRGDTANSLIYEANARLRDPVYGCMGIISALQQEAQSIQAELNLVRAEIMRYRCEESAAIQVAGYQSAPAERLNPSTHITSSSYPLQLQPSSSGASDVKSERFW
eukprot:c12269_g1_i1 orf=376-975(-)